MSVVLCLPAHLCVSTAASRGQAPHGNASGDYVLVQRFQGVTAAENEGTVFYGPYLVTGVTGGGITARCSPTLGGEVNVAHKYLKQWPLSLSVNPDSESDEIVAEAANEDEEQEAEETDQRDVRDEAGQSLSV